jgi:hypothetical protein
METLDMDAQRRELLFSQAHENLLRERSLLSAWHHAALQSNSQHSNKNNNNNYNNNNNNKNKNLSPRYGKIAGKQDGAVDQYFRGIRDRYYGPLSSDSLLLHLSHRIMSEFQTFIHSTGEQVISKLCMSYIKKDVQD